MAQDICEQHGNQLSKVCMQCYDLICEDCIINAHTNHPIEPLSTAIQKFTYCSTEGEKAIQEIHKGFSLLQNSMLLI